MQISRYRAVCTMVQNLLCIIRFFIIKRNARVVWFSIPPEVLFAHLNYDIPETVSMVIDAQNARTAKLAWLIDSLTASDQMSPVQLIQSSGSKYFCHPGSFLALVLTYIVPRKPIHGFYIWYPDHDPAPPILDYQHEIITNPFVFFYKFKSSFFTNLLFGLTTIRSGDDVGADYFSTAREHMRESVSRHGDVVFLTYYDGAWQHTVAQDGIKAVHTTADGASCSVGGVKFRRNSRGYWAVSP